MVERSLEVAKGSGTCRNLRTEEEHRQATDEGSTNVTDDEDSTDHPEISSNKFCIDYSKTGTAKCRKCNKVIDKNILRIGKYMAFKGNIIKHYYHSTCAFLSFEKARVITNVITSIENIDGFDTIIESDRKRINEMVDEANAKRTKVLEKPRVKTKQPILLQEAPKSRLNRLKSSILPSMGIMYTNADQLTTSKMTELKKQVERKKPLIIAVCEVKPKNSDDRTLKEYEIPNYNLHPVNLVNDVGRGIAVYSHTSLEKSTIQVIPNNGFEEVCLLEVRLRGGDTLLFGCCYRSPTPTESSTDNNENLNRLLKYVSSKKYTHVCIVGDFNHKSINWKTWTSKHGEDSNEARFIEGIRDCFFHQHVEKPTRRRGTDEPSTLDLILTNEALQVSEVNHNPPLGKSDHDVLTFEFQCYIDFTQQKERFVFEKGDYKKMRDILNTSTDWFAEYEKLANKSQTTPEELWKSLKSKLQQLTKDCVPFVTPSDKPSWKDKGAIPIDRKARNAIRDKEKAHRKWMSALNSEVSDEARTNYTKARNNVKSLLRKAKRRFERQISKTAKTNPKAFWGHTRRYLKTKSSVAPLLSNPKDKESMKFKDEEKANILLKQFSSVFTKEEQGEIPRINSRTNRKVSNLLISDKMVKDALTKININKSCRPNMLHPRLLKELADLISGPIATLFRSTLKHGILPKDWKHATITPIFKKGSLHLAENYRPISLTSILCKIMEKFIRDHIVTHLLENNLLSKKQFGFITGRSTCLQLLHYLDECLSTTAKGGVVDAIYLDFAKAFDTVPHRRLLGKLEAYGIEGDTLKWIKEFLYDRTQQVSVNGSESSSAPVLSGIPQGTVLGPILFVIYINDLLDNINSNGLMFADDTKIFRRISSRDDSIELQSDITKLEKWSDLWLLRFNSDKCHVLTLGNFENIPHAHRYMIGDKELEHVGDEKDLGVTISAELTFDEHIGRKIRVANAIAGQIRRSFSYLDCVTFRYLFVAFVRPHLEFSQAVWSPHLQKHIDVLENVQARASKLVDGLGNLEYPERLKRLNLPTLVYRRRRGDMIELYKHFTIYDRSILPSTFQPRNRPSRQHPLQLLTPKSFDGKRGAQTNSFYHRSVKTWNNLPKAVVSSKTINDFKNNLDEYWNDDPIKFDYRYQEPNDDTDEE